jgi:TPR repeat
VPILRWRLRRAKLSRITLADRARDAGQWKLAARQYRKVLNRNPRNSPIWVQYGHALKQTGHLAEAEKAYREAIVLDPNAADPHLQLGHVLKLQRRRAEAAAAYHRALDLDPTLHAASREVVALSCTRNISGESWQGRYLAASEDAAPATPSLAFSRDQEAGRYAEMKAMVRRGQFPSSTSPKIRGHFYGVEGSLASGWLADLAAPHRVLTVELFAIERDGEMTKLGEARANRPFDQLRTIGFETSHGFARRIPFRSREFLLSVRVADHGIELPGSPVLVTPSVIYEGYLDGIDIGVLRGWAWGWDPTVAVEIEIFVDGRLRAVVPARTERRDLALAHIGDGRHGFAWLVPVEFADGTAHEFACRIAGTSVWLPGGPRTETVRPGDLYFAATVPELLRGCARRPLPERAVSPLFGDSFRTLLSRIRGSQPRLQPFPVGEPTEEARAAAHGEFWRPLSLAAPVDPGRPSSAVIGRNRVRLLIPVWGPDYIAVFCRTCLPSFFSPNNLPHLARVHDVEVVFLTRSTDRGLFQEYPAYRRLSELVQITFTDIDDILARYFEPSPHAYATALTFAFFRGIRSLGQAALDTDFLFWNADFLAADGVFRTLADLIAARVRCTFAPSLRVDMTVEEAVLAHRRTADGAVLDIGPREWVALALRFPDPTVMAMTVNRFEERMIDTVNQLYWHVNDEVVVARHFLMFMLHIRPERVWDELYGFCDYVFVPEMVPSGCYNFEVQSDRILIIELQHSTREWGDIVFGDEQMKPEDVGRGVARWTTREHLSASRQMVVFNACEIGVDLDPLLRMTDDFMSKVYDRLPDDPIWHNGHFYWRQSLAALGVPYKEPGPDHPRSHLAAALRWTGYDVDILRESWPDLAGPPKGTFGVALPLEPGFDPSSWLAHAHAAYLEAWNKSSSLPLRRRATLELISGHFHGFGWGLLSRAEDHWMRWLGSDGRAVLLLRVQSTTGFRFRAFGVRHPHTALESLRIFINGENAGELRSGCMGNKVWFEFGVNAAAVARAQGRLHILLCESPETVAARCGAGFAFAELVIRPS